MIKNFKNIIFLVSLLTSFSISQAQPVGRIINGVDAPQKYEFMGSLYKQTNRDYFLTCGVTFLSSNYALTAAHCVDDIANYAVGYGSNKLFNQIYVTVIDVIIHPGWNPNNFNNDVAILKLAYKTSAKSIKLPSRKFIKRFNRKVKRSKAWATTIGWGTMHPTKTVVPQQLQQAFIPVYSSKLCRLGSSYFNPKTMLCAGILSSSASVVDGVSSCYGDSGGPLFVTKRGRVTQIGVVSWGYRCANHYYPGVYAKLTKYRKWILKQI